MKGSLLVADACARRIESEMNVCLSRAPHDSPPNGSVTEGGALLQGIFGHNERGFFVGVGVENWGDPLRNSKRTFWTEWEKDSVLIRSLRRPIVWPVWKGYPFCLCLLLQLSVNLGIDVN